MRIWVVFLRLKWDVIADALKFNAIPVAKKPDAIVGVQNYYAVKHYRHCEKIRSAYHFVIRGIFL